MPACVDYGFYRDAYGGQMTPEALAGALPAACGSGVHDDGERG